MGAVSLWTRPPALYLCTGPTAGTCRCGNTATSTTTELHLPLQLHNRDINRQMYGNWANLNDHQSLDHEKSLCATTKKSTSLKKSCNCGTSRQYVLSGPRHQDTQAPCTRTAPVNRHHKKSKGLPTIKGTQRKCKNSARYVRTSKSSHATVVNEGTTAYGVS